MNIELFCIRCPACYESINLKTRKALIYKGVIYCHSCQALLTPSIFSSVVATCVLGVPAWLLTDVLLNPLHVNAEISYVIGFSLCMGVAKLASPLANLIQVKEDQNGC
ncbi:hypothetical protein SG34_016790 [Thalassomonas viridans]|uniref:Uncharacterized protein n=1 Tax=Thalassomonas viridans TaxID=137584 RepID=A0AAE9YXL0_9GAMM|nr:hypothetical protein [Thalassomonas viridans]WDE03081.1 hypothetical protein SG34_016790 [Thalassomonas viridans]